MIEYELQGMDAIIFKMRTLANDMRRKVAMGATRRAARVVTNAAKVNAQAVDDPNTGRRIASNIQQRFNGKFYKATGDIMYRVGVASPKGKTPKGNPDEGDKGPTPHWHLLELGTEKMRAQPFMGPALSNNVEAAMSVFSAEMNKGIEKL